MGGAAVNSTDAILFIAVVICGLVMLGYAFRPQKLPLRRWSRNCWILLAVAMMTWGVLGWTSRRASLSEVAYWRIDHAKTWAGGLATGIFVTLVISGEFARLFRRSPSDRTPKP
jgi:multisubunit Na+/H+ antiporter MnhB subunit